MNFSQSHHESESARRTLTDIVRRYSATHAPEQAHLEFYKLIEQCTESGWSRFMVYNLVHETLIALPLDCPDYLVDLLDNYETGLTGDCHVSCIARFTGEPEWPEFLHYVYARKWLLPSEEE